MFFPRANSRRLEAILKAALLGKSPVGGIKINSPLTISAFPFSGTRYKSSIVAFALVLISYLGDYYKSGCNNLTLIRVISELPRHENIFPVLFPRDQTFRVRLKASNLKNRILEVIGIVLA